jgi:DNA repair exonuclease SbcCD ATPase subunit
MKNHLLILFIAFFQLYSWSAVAQEMRDGVKSMSAGVQHAVYTDIAGVTEELVNDTWKEYIKKYGGKHKWNRKAKELFSEGVMLPNISSEPINLYAAAIEGGSSVQFILWLQSPDGTFYTQERLLSQQENLQNLMTHFELEVKREDLRAIIKDEEKLYNKQESDLKKLEKSKERLHKDIEDAQEKIKKSEAEIEQNIKDQELSRQQIKSQQDKLEALRKKLSNL